MISNIFSDFGVPENCNLIDNEYGSFFPNSDLFPMTFIKINDYDETYIEDQDSLIIQTRSDIPLIGSYRHEVVCDEGFYDQVTSLIIELPGFDHPYPKHLKTLIVYGTEDGFEFPDCERIFLFDFKKANFKLNKVKELYLLNCEDGDLKLPEGIIELFAKKFTGTVKFPDSLKIVKLSKIENIPDLNNVESLNIDNYDGEFEPSDKLITLSMEKYTGVNKPVFKAKNIRNLKISKYRGKIEGRFKILVTHS